MDASAEAGVPFEAVEIAERPRPVQDAAAVWRLRALLRRSRPDVVHAHGLRAAAVAALAIGRGRPRPRLVVTVHNAAPAGGAAGAVYRVLERLVARRADAVLCVSSDLEARMRALGAKGVGRALVPAPSPAQRPLPHHCPFHLRPRALPRKRRRACGLAGRLSCWRWPGWRRRRGWTP